MRRTRVLRRISDTDESYLARLNETVLAHFAENSRQEGECVVWTGKVDDDCYGVTSVAGLKTRVHRAAWIARHGQPPADRPWILHHCDNPPCFRDDHTYAGTPRQNNEDRARRDRSHHGPTWGARKTHCPAGHPYDAANTYVWRNERQCRICRRAARARSAAKKST